MESTGVYWQPVYHILNEGCEVIVGNARRMRQIPGRKTDKTDADWISELLAHGLIAPSFVPPPEIRALRNLMRMRTGLVQTRTQAKNRTHQILEDCNIKLGTVAADIFGKSGRRMLEALIAGERDPERLADMALRRLRSKIRELGLALQGRFTEHHGAMLRLTLDLIDTLNSQIDALDRRISELLAPLFCAEIEQLSSIPGLQETAARQVIAEIGTNMAHFGSAGRLASWVGLCPGNNESAGKRRSGKTRKGNRYVRRVLVQSAWAAAKTDTFLGDTFRRLQARIGGKKAAVAVADKIVVIIYHLLSEGTFYEEERYKVTQDQREERQRQTAIRALERAGYQVVKLAA
jgi:transposase